MLSYDYKVYVNFSCSNSRFSFTGRIGDHLPDKLVIHLLSSLTVKAVYERMVEEMMGSSMLPSSVMQPATVLQSMERVLSSCIYSYG